MAKPANPLHRYQFRPPVGVLEDLGTIGPIPPILIWWNSTRLDIPVAIRRGRPKLENEGQETLGEIPQNFAELPGKETLEVAATKAGFGNKETYRQAKTVVENAEPELVAGQDAVDEVGECKKSDCEEGNP